MLVKAHFSKFRRVLFCGVFPRFPQNNSVKSSPGHAEISGAIAKTECSVLTEILSIIMNKLAFLGHNIVNIADSTVDKPYRMVYHDI